MATYVHGKNAALVHGAVDLSPWTSEATTTATADPADTSHFGSNAKTYILGQVDGTFSFGGLFDGTTDAIHPYMAEVLANETQNGPAIPVALAPEGIKVGALAVVGLAKQTTYEVNVVLSDVVKVAGEIQITDGISYGVFLLPLTPVTVNTLGAGWDNAIASTDGGRATLHLVDNNNSGAVSVKVQHSVDGSVWVDLATFTDAPTLTSATQTINLTGTINRYTRLSVTLAGTGAVSVTGTISRN